MRLAWQRAGVRPEVWQRRPDHAFRRAFRTGLLALGANPDAVDYLQGHEIAGSRGSSIDAQQLPLAAALALIPAIVVPAEATVVPFPRTGAGERARGAPIRAHPAVPSLASA